MYQDIVNPVYCDILSKISFTQFKDIYKNVNLSNNTDKNAQSIIYAAVDDDELFKQFKLVVNYCKEIKKHDYKLVKTYKNAPCKDDGRIFVVGMGLQRIWGVLRGALCDGLLIDLDMKNAHCCILQYICKINNIICCNLDKYIVNRNNIFNEFIKSDNIDKITAKLLFIISLNSEKNITHIGKPKIKYDFFIQYDNEIKKIQKQLTEIYVEKFKSYVNMENALGKFTNYLLTLYENEFLDEAIEFLNKNNYEVCVPMFDGVMIKHTNTNNLIDKLDNLTSKYGIKWDIKPHNIELQPILSNLDISKNVFSFVGEHEIEVCNYVLDNILVNKIYNSNGELWLYNNNIWINNNIHEFLIGIISIHDLSIYTILGKKKIARQISKNYSCLFTLIKLVMATAPQNPQFSNLLYSNTLQKICYLNGFYSFVENKFIKYKDDNIPFTTHIINRDYIDVIPDKMDIDNVYKEILHPIFNIVVGTNTEDENKINTDYMNFILNRIARMLAGHIEDKKWLMLIGNRNSGKGVIEHLLISSFDKYIGTFNSDNLISKSANMGESSKNAAWMLNFRFVRVCFGNELLTNEKTILNGCLIKNLVSGGSRITARTNNKDEISVNIQSSIILTSNDMPTINPIDTLETMIKFNMPIKFMSDDEYKKLTDIEKKIYKRLPKNDNIKNLCVDLKFIRAFEYILYESYKLNNPKIPDIISKEDDAELANDGNNNKFLEYLDFGTGEEFLLYNNDIKNLLTSLNITMTINKVGKFLLNMGCKREYIENKRCFSGVKLK